MRKILISILTIFIGLTIFSQTNFQIEADLGTSFQSEIIFNNQKLNHTNTFSVRVGANMQQYIYQDFFMELGVFGKYNRGSNEIKQLHFKSNSLRLQVPLYIGYKINKKWSANTGISIENNRDFDVLDLRKTHNLRYDFLTKVVYHNSKNIHYVFYSNWSLSNKPDFYNIANPKNGIYIGVIYQFKKTKKENHEK